MKKNNLYFLFLLLVLACGKKQETMKTQDSAMSPATNAIPTPATTQYQFPKLEFPEEFYTSNIYLNDTVLHTSFYSEFVQSKLPGMQRFNRLVADEVQKQIDVEYNYFLKHPDEMLDHNQRAEFTFDLRPVSLYTGKRIISITHVIDTYSDGAAHHNYNWFTINYDTKTNTVIKFKDLLEVKTAKDSVGFDELLNNYSNESSCHWNLSKGEDQNFSLSEDSIRLNLDSWSCWGTHSVIPLDSCSKYMKDKWRKILLENRDHIKQSN